MPQGRYSRQPTTVGGSSFDRDFEVMAIYRKLAAVLLGSLSLAMGIHLFLVPNRLLDGGFIGIALILNYLWGWKIGWTAFALSIPIYVYAWFCRRTYFFNSMLGMSVSFFLIDWMHRFLPTYGAALPLSPLTGSFVGGALVGTGAGMMLRYHVSAEGTDLFGLLVSEKLSVNVGVVIYALDLLIVLSGAFVVRDEPVTLSLIMILAAATVTTLFTLRRPDSLAN
ncbi:YitT family protein [Cohnella zeiphila]|uniref:YitT family protein n=1 Tax=Cohnella zeiphila TaxID=2761120 RepID=A0A7X0VWT9_9BACL|nr:YitT family protein [Cohnella zeiphila]MBB6733584.1 YitT family protein [Cohnella zeiphila]